MSDDHICKNTRYTVYDCAFWQRNLIHIDLVNSLKPQCAQGERERERPRDLEKKRKREREREGGGGGEREGERQQVRAGHKLL